MKITCRICKIQQGEFFTLDSTVSFSGQREYKLLYVYNKCFQLDALLVDALPQVVCLPCLEKLKEFFEFQLKAEKSDLEFRENVPDALIQDIKNEISHNYNAPQMIVSPNLEACIRTKIEDITSADEFDSIHEENYESDEKVHDEELEDTDILFELYNKNDSCIEKYLKLENNDFEKNVDESKLPDNNIVPLETISSDEINPPLESAIPSIEITRMEFPVQYEVQTPILGPLVEIRKWQCRECGRKYITKEKLEQHRKLHNPSVDCECEICGYLLKSLYEYKEHMKSHGTERKFSCEFCDKTFSTRANLKAHIYIHTNLRPFKCEICDKAFQQKSILKTHMTLHTGKPFECTLCYRRFSRTAHLNIHMRQHNNIRPYRCNQCPNAYMQKSHLDRHISSSHLGIRFQCTVCGKMYTKKPSLNTHMREAHCTSVSLHNCTICNTNFDKQKGLYYHLKSKHPDCKKN